MQIKKTNIHDQKYPAEASFKVASSGNATLMYIPTRRNANIRDVNANIRANVAFAPEANYSH